MGKAQVKTNLKVRNQTFSLLRDEIYYNAMKHITTLRKKDQRTTKTSYSCKYLENNRILTVLNYWPLISSFLDSSVVAEIDPKSIFERSE